MNLSKNRIFSPFGFLFSFSIILLGNSTLLSQYSSDKTDSLILIVADMPEDSIKVKTLFKIGAGLVQKFPEEAERYYAEAAELGEKINEIDYLGVVYAQLALINNNKGNLERSDQFLLKSKDAVENKPSDIGWAGYYQAEGLIYGKRKEHKKAIESLKNNLKYAKVVGNDTSLAGVYLNLGNNYSNSEQYKKAIENYFEALNIFEGLDNERGISFCYSALASVYRDLKQYKDAIKYGHKSLELKIKENNERGIAKSYSILSESNLGLKNYEKATENAQKALDIFMKYNQTFDVLGINRVLGRIYSEQKDFPKAKSYYDKAIFLAGELKNEKLLKEISTEREEKIQTVVSDFTEEKKMPEVDYVSDLEKARAEGDTTALMNNLKALSKFYLAENNYQKAYEHNEEYHHLKELTAGPAVMRELKQLESRYELEKRESAIQLLEKDKQLNEEKLQKQRIGLWAFGAFILLMSSLAYMIFSRFKIRNKLKRKAEMEKMRQEIASDLHDDIGSTLSSIQIISGLMEKKAENPKVKEAAENISNLSYKVAGGMREIVWSLNPKNDTLEAVSDQMRKLAVEILEPADIHFSFDFNLKNPQKKLSPEMRKNLMMLYKEAINNARKYSRSSKVDISFSENKQGLKLSIRDYGCGFDPKETINGNGLSNMELRAKNMNGQLYLKSKKNEGTEIKLEALLP